MVLIAAKCNVNNRHLAGDKEFHKVLIAAKCNVNEQAEIMKEAVLRF